MNQPDSYRVFIALELPAPVKSALQAPLIALQKQLPSGVRWVRPDSLHVTLKFLGDVPHSGLTPIQEGLAACAAGSSPFRLQAVGLGCFPRPAAPKVIWIGLKGDMKALHRLRDAVESTIAPLGYPTEDRPYNPHLTLGRVATQERKLQAHIGEVVQNTLVDQVAAWSAEGISLMRSELGRDGAVYTPLAHIQFSKEQDPGNN